MPPPPPPQLAPSRPQSHNELNHPSFPTSSLRSQHHRRSSSSWLRRLSIPSFDVEGPPPSSASSSTSTPDPSFASNSLRSSSLNRSRGSIKFLKRSASLRLDSNPFLARPFSSSNSRPATSFQGTTNGLSGPESTLQPDLFALDGLSSNSVWAPYLSTTSSPALSSAADLPSFSRCILPDSNAAPVLLPATSITRKHSNTTQQRTMLAAPVNEKFNDPWQSDSSIQPEPLLNPDMAQPSDMPHDSEKLPPPTQINLPETVPEASPETKEPPPSEQIPPELLDEKLEDRPTFSLNGVEPVIAAVAMPGETAPSIRKVSSLRRVKGRTFSHIPIPELSNGNTHHRRVVTHPSDSRYIRSVSPRKGGDDDESPLNLASWSRPSSIDMTFLHDVNQLPRPASAGAVSLPYRQQQDLTLALPFRQRIKRLSNAPSDPSSGVVSSDDGHTLTSGGEEETDFQSETAFDSLRTYATTGSSRSRSRGPRIETVFAAAPNNMPATDGVPKEEITGDSNLTIAPAQDGSGDTVSSTHDISPPPSNWTDESSRNSGIDPLSDEEEQHRKAAMDTDSSQFQQLSSDLPHCDQISPDASRRSNIFDWSEKHREVPGTEPRPTTVHGKQGNELRVSRQPSRKGPNAMHLRSQSVPAARDSPANETPGKFGTWGLGNKGPSEDWDSDFDFDDSEESGVHEDGKQGNNNNNVNGVVGGFIGNGKKVPGQRGMIVPQEIMERQASLHGQFGQVQELTLLVEELKRLRQQANVLQISTTTATTASEPSNELWKEAEGIVNLATVDDDDDNDHHSNTSNGRQRQLSRSPSSVTLSFSDDSDDDNDNEKSTSHNHNQPPPTSDNNKPTVLDIIYQQRTAAATGEPTTDSLGVDAKVVSRTRKLPFDTQSLQDLVARAGVVTRSLKETVRKAEGVTVTNGSDLDDSRLQHQQQQILDDNDDDDDLWEL